MNMFNDIIPISALNNKNIDRYIEGIKKSLTRRTTIFSRRYDNRST